MSVSSDIVPGDEEFYAEVPEYRAIAKAVGCSATDVARAFEQGESPELYTNARIDEYKRLLEVLAKAEAHGKEFARALHNLDPLGVEEDGVWLVPPSNVHRVLIEHASKVDVQKLRAATEKLVEEIVLHRRSFESTFTRLPKLGRNHEPSSRLLLDALGRLFDSLGQEITYGHNDGKPSTKFSKTAEAAFATYGLKTKWRRATQEWVKKHKAKKKT